MATTPGGLVYPVTTDAFDPSGDIEKLARSGDAGRIIPVPNTTARNALIAALTAAGHPPSAENAVYVHRRDAAPGQKMEVTEDGDTWATIPAQQPGIALIPRSGWGVGGSGFAEPSVRRAGSLIEVTGGRIYRSGGAFAVAAGGTIEVGTDLPAVAGSAFILGTSILAAGTVDIVCACYVTQAGVLTLRPTAGATVATGATLYLAGGRYYV